jgi:hypothetical protein
MTTGYSIIRRDELPRGSGTWRFQGARYGGGDASFIIAEMQPGQDILRQVDIHAAGSFETVWLE